jgi:hypothetical protein
MPNGAAALAVLPAEPPIEAAADLEVERSIGEAAASAAMAIGFGMVDYAASGEIRPPTRQSGAKALADTAMLALEHDGTLDFGAVARREGRAVLERRHGAMLREHLPAARIDAAFGELIDQVLAIVGRVVAIERALAN